MDKLMELEQKHAAKLREVNQITVDKPDFDWSADELKSFQDGQKELNAIFDQILPLRSAKQAAEENAKRLGEYNEPVRRVGHAPASNDDGKTSRDEQPSRKSIGEAFVDSEQYKGWSPDPHRVNMKAYVEVAELGFKTTFTTSGATLTQYDRQPGIVLIGQQRLTIADLLAQGQTNMNTIRYMQEDTFTNAATTVSEGATKPEAAWDLSEQDATVRKIAVTSKVTDELFADFPAVRDYIDNRMRFMVQQTEEAQLYGGDGSAPNIRGLVNTSGIQTQAKGSDPVPDAVYKAITKVRTVGFFEPDGVVFHPNDWTDVRLLRTADGLYIWGSPLEMGPERIWGLPVVVTTAATEGTALVGAFKLGAQIFRREGIRVEATNSNEDDFKKNLIAIRCEERLALAVYRPKAFCTVTGI